jgi:HAMP domain-containing protein
MPGIVAMAAALLFTLIFNYFVNYYVVSPLVRITDRIKKFIENKVPFDVDIETKDEFSELVYAIKILSETGKLPETEA